MPVNHEQIQLSEGELRRSPITFFDIDGTLTQGFTIFSFAEYLKDQGIMDLRAFQMMESDFVAYSVSDKSDYPYRKFAIDLVDHYAFGLAGVPTQEVSESSEKFWEKALDGEIKDYQVLGFAKELTRLMSILGRTIAITGSPIESIRPLQRHLGISEAAGTILHIDSGRFTGLVVRNTALDVQKQKVVAEYLDHSINTKLSFAFGDSVHDLPLLEAVGNPFVLGDNAHLRQIGRDRNWTVITQQDEVLSLVNDRLRSLTS